MIFYFAQENINMKKSLIFLKINYKNYKIIINKRKKNNMWFFNGLKSSETRLYRIHLFDRQMVDSKDKDKHKS